MTDTFRTLTAFSTGEFKDKGSKFLGYALPLAYPRFSVPTAPEHTIDATEFASFLEKLRKEHPKARHFCYAWRLDTEGYRFRANDDGEPSGTAGRPILGQIDSFGLTHVGVVVVRYFGGTLLGTSGLINAYREGAAAALGAGQIVEKTIQRAFSLRFAYDKMPDVMNALKRADVSILSQNFDATEATVVFSTRLSEIDDKLLKIKALSCRISLDEAAFYEKNKPNWCENQGLFFDIFYEQY